MINNRFEQKISRYFSLIILLFFIFLASPSFASEEVVVFYLDKQYRPVAKLDRLGSKSEGLYAILAMYAWQSGGGCQGRDSSGLKCELTKALGLGAQCSDKHLNLVRSWFKDTKVPSMSIYRETDIDRAFKSGDLKPICYNAPDTATVQSIWEIIRVKTENNIVFVDAIRFWTFRSGADGPHYRMRYKAKYQINKDSISVLEHKEIPMPLK